MIYKIGETEKCWNMLAILLILEFLAKREVLAFCESLVVGFLLFE